VEAEGQRFNVLRCGRRWGKSFFIAVKAILSALQGWPVGVFGPEYNRLRPIWDVVVMILGEQFIVHKDETRMRLVVPNGGIIEFWSWETPGAGRSRRYKMVLLDEAGLLPDLITRFFTDIFPTLTDFDGTAWLVGTPDLKFPDLNVMWEWGQGTRTGWKSWERPSWDNPHLPPMFFEMAKEQMTDEQFAQEFEGKPVEPKSAFFSSKVIAQHKAQHARPALQQGNIVALSDDPIEIDEILTAGEADQIKFVPDPDRGRWQVWSPVSRQRGSPHNRPDQSRMYVFGVDIATGNGSSNSIISVVDAETYNLVGKYECSRVTPHELAEVCVAAALWWGGIAPALVVSERNGPGENFLERLLELDWPNVYRDRPTAKAKSKDRSDYGWRSTAQSKETLLGRYRAALGSTGYINRSARALDECLRYIYDEHNRVVYVAMGAAGGVSDGETPHGDHVIADALACLGCTKVDRIPLPEPRGDHGSRIEEERRRKAAARRDDW